MLVRVRKGLNIPIAGAPDQRIFDSEPVGWVALVARDFRGIRPQLLVEVVLGIALSSCIPIRAEWPSVTRGDLSGGC